MAYPDYVVIFRGRRACPCLAAWLPEFEKELLRRKLIKRNIDITQLIGGAAASGGTHTRGGAFDIWQTGQKVVEVARLMGAPATWYRPRSSSWSPHIHGVLNGCPHNGPARYRITEVFAGGDGLRGNARDTGRPAPPPKRTWKEGIAWATSQQPDQPPEDDMPTPEEFWKADLVPAPQGSEDTWQVASVLHLLARESLKQTKLLEQLIEAQGKA